MYTQMELDYAKKYNPGAYIDMVGAPVEGRTIEDIFQEVQHHEFRILNIINFNAYLITGGVHHGTGCQEGVVFWKAVYIHNNQSTYAMGGKKMYILYHPRLMKKEKINETENICIKRDEGIRSTSSE